MVFGGPKNTPPEGHLNARWDPKANGATAWLGAATINQRLAAFTNFTNFTKTNPPICCGRDTWQTSCFFACLKMFRSYFFVIGSVIDILQQLLPKQTNKPTNQPTNKQTNKHKSVSERSRIKKYKKKNIIFFVESWSSTLQFHPGTWHRQRCQGSFFHGHGPGCETKLQPHNYRACKDHITLSKKCCVL